MEENRLYIDMDILNARARGDADYLEVPHSCLRIGREIGKGAFGRVFMASAVKLPGFNGPKIVAIKQLKRNCTIGMPCDCEYMKDFPEFLFVSHYEENVATISWRPLSNESWQQISSAHSVELQMA
ncbi:tyrosine-protein kinase [Anopheles sinensis]|uniref:Tyrosine-protein kinase n=1 Tax=Anopheles sinensis TaxID=74873 RepID=A0A084VPY8_ANOSI|nr:tyrosine-protein kinase [Anopheles sinensis]